MPRHILYAYVDGFDLQTIAEELESRLKRFVENVTWRVHTPTVVNDHQPDDPTLESGDLPDWVLGLNLELPEFGNEPLGWFSDVERIARFLGDLNKDFGRDFVIGIGDNERGFREDLFFVDSPTPDLKLLRQIIGVQEATDSRQTGGSD